MRGLALCLCCLGLVASVALADRQLQMLEVGGRVPALKVAQLGPDGLITKWVDVSHGPCGGGRQLIFDCYEPDVDDCTGNGFWYPIGFNSCGYGEPEDCIPPGCVSRWFYGEDFCNMYTTNDMEFDPNYGGVEAKDIYLALFWYVAGPGSGENAALLIETYEEFDETCNEGDPGDPGFDNNTSDPGYIDGIVMNFGYVDSGAGVGYYCFVAEDLDPDVRLQLPFDGAGSYNLWMLTYTGDDPTWPDDYSIATCAQPMLWGTGTNEWPEQDCVNRGLGACPYPDGPGDSSHQGPIQWDDLDGDGWHTAPEECRDYGELFDVCPDPLGAMICFCAECDDDDDGYDQSDLGELLAAWCSHPGDPNWNPNVDLDGDGHVGHGDLGILLADWG